MFSKLTRSFLILFFLFSIAKSQPQQVFSSGEIQLALKKLNVVGSVLYIAAHPDDENTRLLAYLANEKLLRTAYLSITRGDGGQNLIGSEQEELLGMIRTQELLAARKIDKAEQFFTRAIDFGYSKNPEETFSIWDKEKILSDVVFVIRKFQPDIIITRFPTNGDGGHGHHTASAILAEEAFKAAADPNRFPEQLKFVSVWQAKRLLWNSFVPRDTKPEDTLGLMKLDVGVFNPLLGKSYGEIAGESRSMHKSQGFGVSKNRGSVIEYFKFIAGDSSKNIFDGIDFTWKRVKGAEKLSQLFPKAYSEFNPEKPETTVPVLLEAYKKIQSLSENNFTIQKKKELENLIVACSGIWAEANAAEFSANPNSEIKIISSFVKRTTVDWKLEKIIFSNEIDTTVNKKLNNNEILNFEKQIKIDSTFQFRNPYWLNEKHGKGIFSVSNQNLIGLGENPNSLSVSFILSLNNQPFTINRPITYKWVDPIDGEKYRPLEIVPPVTANFSNKAFMFPNGNSKEISVTLKSAIENANGNIKLQLPDGWKSEPQNFSFTMKTKGEEQVVKFLLTPPKYFQNLKDFGNLKVKAIVEIGNEKISKSVTRIEYKHIPPQVLFSDAEAKLVSFPLEKHGKKIGYIPGAGDQVAECLKQIGYDVSILNDEMLSNQSLKDFDAIIVGIRAFNTNERMKFYHEKLMDYIFQGGNLIVQYNTNNFLSTVKTEIGPYPFKISRDRVTVEEIPIHFDNTTHPLLNFPNKISDSDFDGWIQERGLYFANEWDEKYETVISSNDPGEKPLKGSIITAKYGKGNFVYTGLAFFRQLPAGVPGAYKFFVNMIDLGK